MSEIDVRTLTRTPLRSTDSEVPALARTRVEGVGFVADELLDEVTAVWWADDTTLIVSGTTSGRRAAIEIDLHPDIWEAIREGW